MFANLIESTSHQQDLARKGRFFLATLISYALIVACAGLVSIYAYDAHLEDNQDLEFLGLVPPIVPDKAANTPKNSGPKTLPKNKQTSTLGERTVAIDRVATSTKIPTGVSAIKSDVPEIPVGAYKIGTSNKEPVIGGPGIDGPPGGNGGTGPVVKMETTPPPKNETAAQPKKEMIKSGGVMNGQATFLPRPEYSNMAKTVHASGPVNVQVLIDETGKVISARATIGHPLLRSAAVRAAYQSRFSPTLLSGVPVKVSGVINYNFSLQ